MAATQASLPAIGTELETAVERFEDAWHAGPPPDLNAFIPPPPSPSRGRVLKELVKVDLEFRWRSWSGLSKGGRTATARTGGSHTLEEYLTRFPELSGRGKVPLDLITEEFRVRTRWGDKPQIPDYVRRFPEHGAYLADALRRLQAELAAEFSQVRSAGTPPPFNDAHSTITEGRPRSPGSHSVGHELPRVPGYEVLGVLGKGGMGVVYKARHLALGRLVAIKMMLGSASQHEEKQRFRTEARALAQLEHPNIVHVYEVGEHGDRAFIALELVDGGTLKQRLALGIPDSAESAHIVETLALAVEAAHSKHVLHRDLKPQNVLLAGAEHAPLDECLLKITDFGLAKCLDATAGPTQSGAVLGTPSYMAPEQAEGRTHDVGPAADVYGLGAILFELLTGRPPFLASTPLDTILQVISDEPTPPRRINPKTPAELERICLKCLQKDPRRRYATCRDLADDLGRWLSRNRGAKPMIRIDRDEEPKAETRFKTTFFLGLGVGITAALGIGLLAWALAGGLAKEEAKNLGKEAGKDAGAAAKEKAVVQPAKATLADLRATITGVVGTPFSPGDKIVVNYQIANPTDQNIDVPMKDRFNVVGIYQWWMEYLDGDGSVPAVPARIARKGRLYGHGGSIVPYKPEFKAGAVHAMQATFQTVGFPPGKYKYLLEWKTPDDVVIDSKEITIELQPEVKKEMGKADPLREFLGTPAPEAVSAFSFNSATDKLSDLKGKTILLDFWACWCPPCHATFPHLREWHRQYKDQGLEIVSVTTYYEKFVFDKETGQVKKQDDKIAPEAENEMLMEFAAHHKLTHRMMTVKREDWRQLHKTYKVPGVPYFVLVDRSGVIRMVRVGAIDENFSAIGEEIRKLLAEK